METTLIIPVPAEPIVSGWPAGSPGADDSGSGPFLIFEPQLLPSPAATVAFMRRLDCDGVVIAEKQIWSMRLEDADEADRCLAWMRSKAADWIYWGRFATAFGVEEIVALVADGFRNDALRIVEAELAAQEDRDAEAERANEIWSRSVEKGGRFGLDLRRGLKNESLWVVLFREKWERERFRDWFWAQEDRWDEMLEYIKTHDGKDLERKLLAEMLQTEREVKKAGLGAGGRRPLRFWRGGV